MTLTNAAALPLLLFVALLTLALALGNLLFLYTGAVALAFVTVGVALAPPRTISAQRTISKERPWVNEVVEMTWDVRVEGGGTAILALADALPKEFELVEGNNLRVAWTWWGRRTLTFRYTFRCSKRGRYVLAPTALDMRHPLGFYVPRQGAIGNPIEITVAPRITNVRRIRGMRGIANTPPPTSDMARMGVATTDFREIRVYHPGDPVKSINWKATARHFSRGASIPLVNEYEFEGRKAVWLFLDAASYMEIGTNIDNAFERATEATSALAFYFLERGYRVGAYIYNYRPEKLLYPDTGMRQFYRISREMVALETSSESRDLRQAVEACKKYLLWFKPLSIIVTRLDVGDIGSLLRGTRTVIQMNPRRRLRTPVMVVGINGYYFAPRRDDYEENAQTFYRLQTRAAVSRLRGLGVSVLEWDPTRYDFSTALMRHLRTR
ncbi:MAG: DUF58 domain-containing protein [Chloroflexi bacterium]|nr:DUF58 domain-containing protein [Chloroflexota bacterium]